jgi:amidase
MATRAESATQAARSFLETVDGDGLRAWTALDGDQLLAEAARLDSLPAHERAALPLFGLLVGVKDIFDTATLPTTYGSPIYEGHRPQRDAALVADLRARGALIAGKTASAEFAWMSPPATVNPLDPTRTPGGSSSGSAAAVAAGHVRVATGTQTAGSINRPASYCAVIGFKPTFGTLPREGVKLMSPALDTVGYLAASIPDLCRVIGHPVRASTRPARIGFLRTPYWERIQPEARRAIEALGVSEVQAPAGFEALTKAQRTIQWYDSARSLNGEYEQHRELLTPALVEALEEGRAMSSMLRAEADRTLARVGPPLARWLEGFDAILTPSADGVPPVGIEFTGDPLFSRAWTLIGAPCLSIPVAWTSDGLPAGVQLVGAPGSDARVLAAGQALMDASG